MEKQKFISGQVVEVLKDNQLQKATITNVGNYYLHAKVGLDFEQRYKKEDFQGMVGAAKERKQKLNDGSTKKE